MTNLYHDLANIYEAMYQTFIDYQKEYDFYSRILLDKKVNSVLEIGSGTGNLAAYFINNKFDYYGLDYSNDMIDIARNKVPSGRFIQGDMRDFELNSPVESVMITGRTISYLLQNEDISLTFSSIFKNLLPGGLLCFDFIDANQFIPSIAEGKKVVHQADFDENTYVRESEWKPNLEYGMGFDWQSVFYKKEKSLIEIGRDTSTIRTFTINEIEIFLSINGFVVKDVIERPSYAFPTYVVVAEKKNHF